MTTKNYAAYYAIRAKKSAEKKAKAKQPIHVFNRTPEQQKIIDDNSAAWRKLKRERPHEYARLMQQCE